MADHGMVNCELGATVAHLRHICLSPPIPQAKCIPEFPFVQVETMFFQWEYREPR